MKIVHLRFCFLVALVVGSLGLPGQSQAEDPSSSAMFVARHLDVLSIPSSIEPRRRPGANLLSEYGFTKFTPNGTAVDATDDDGEWLFSIAVVSGDGRRKLLCITDHVLKHTFLTVGPVEVELGRDGLFHGTGRTVHDSRCPEYRR